MVGSCDIAQYLYAIDGRFRGLLVSVCMLLAITDISVFVCAYVFVCMKQIGRVLCVCMCVASNYWSPVCLSLAIDRFHVCLQGKCWICAMDFSTC